MHRLPSLLASLLALGMSLALIACGSGGSSNPGPMLSSDASLSALEVSSGTLTPAFDPATFTYSVGVGLTVLNATVTPTSADANATITVDGVAVLSGDPSDLIALSTGPNPVLIVVTAEDGSTQDYTVVITRAASLAQEAFIKASNAGPDDLFGTSTGLTLVGDTLVVAAQQEDASATGGESDNSVSGSGAVYVYVRTGTTWTQQAYLKASNAGANDNFGVHLCLDNNTLVVGAYGESSDPTIGPGDDSIAVAGAAYVFVRDGTTWTEQAMLKATEPEVFDFFGGSVCISGDTIAVGAIFEDSSASGGEMDNSAEDAGAVYVFTRAGTTWTQQAFLKASNAASGDRFGESVTMLGDTLVVGATREDANATAGESDNSETDSGAVYVFTRAGTTWTQQAYLKASNAGAGDSFGTAVSIFGDTIAVGATGEASTDAGNELDDSGADAGAAYVFVRSGTTWTQQAYIKAINPDAGDWLGDSVSLYGDTLVVGASSEGSTTLGGLGDNSVMNAGAAYVYTRTGTTWTAHLRLKSPFAEIDDFYGDTVSVFGDTIVVSASSEDSSATGGAADNSTSNSGAVFVYK